MKSTIATKLIPGLALLFGIAIATSTALMSLTSILLMVMAFFVPDFKNSVRQALTNKFVLYSCLFFALFVLGVFWSNAEYPARIKMLSRMVAYGGAPLLYVALSQANSAKLVLKGFVAGAVLSAICSVLAYVFKHPILQGTTDGLTDGALFKWTIFRGHLLHDAFLAIAASLLLVWLVFTTNSSARVKMLLVCAYLLCLVDAMFLVQGRTGQIMFILMSLFVFVYRFKLKGIIFSLIGIVVMIPILLWSAPALKSGIAEYKVEQAQLQQGNYNTSAGLRKQFHFYSLALIKQRPLFGYGTGSFADNYARQVAGTNFIRTKNPHGDLFLIGVELGLAGVIAFVLMLLANCRELLSRTHTPLYSCLGLTLLFGYIIALTQNSFFMDNVTGLAYLLLMLSILVLNAQRPEHE